jgi:hypothetical protein
LPFIRLSADSLLPAFLDHFSRKYFTLTFSILFQAQIIGWKSGENARPRLLYAENNLQGTAFRPFSSGK